MPRLRRYVTTFSRNREFLLFLRYHPLILSVAERSRRAQTIDVIANQMPMAQRSGGYFR